MNTKEVMMLAATVFMTVIAWVVFELYAIHASTPTEEQIESVSFSYNIDPKIFDILKSKTR